MAWWYYRANSNWCEKWASTVETLLKKSYLRYRNQVIRLINYYFNTINSILRSGGTERLDWTLRCSRTSHHLLKIVFIAGPTWIINMNIICTLVVYLIFFVKVAFSEKILYWTTPSPFSQLLSLFLSFSKGSTKKIPISSKTLAHSLLPTKKSYNFLVHFS